MTTFESLDIRGAKSIVDAHSGTSVFPVRDPHTLIQAAGYLKYVLAAKNGNNVYFRGQASLHPTLSPTLYRGCSTVRAQSSRNAAVNRMISEVAERSGLLRRIPSALVEPLLQHYGTRTSWLDLVDNVWVALWFACHRANSRGTLGEFLHFERRQPRKEPENNRYAYIILVAVDFAGAETDFPGYWCGEKTELVDLRVVAPSIFVRPHAQHGLLFRNRGDRVWRDVDYKSSIAGVIQVGLEDALEWLGEGSMLNVHSLFPPPFYDGGYKILLDMWPSLKNGTNRTVGTVAHVGA